jgi:dipeptidyl-peptidase-4
MRPLLAAALVLLVAGCGREATSPAPQSKLTIDRIFASPDLSGPTPRSLKLSPDGRFATLLKSRPDDRDRYDLWAMDTSTGAMRMLVD